MVEHWIEPRMPSLGEFVRRERIRIGLPQRALADRVGVSESYLQKIEQDVTRTVSEGVLAGLVTVFALTEDEAMHLRVLAGGGPAVYANRPVSPDLTMILLDAVLPHPAARYSGWRVIDANRAFDLLWPGLSQAPSMLEWMLTDVRARQVTPNWLEEVTEMVAWFRAYAGDPDPFRRDLARGIMEHLWEVAPIFRPLWRTGLVRHTRRDRVRRVRVHRTVVSVSEVLLPWPQQGKVFEALFLGLITVGESAVRELLGCS